jgi:hypothetical protein
MKKPLAQQSLCFRVKLKQGWKYLFCRPGVPQKPAGDGIEQACSHR